MKSKWYLFLEHIECDMRRLVTGQRSGHELGLEKLHMASCGLQHKSLIRITDA